MSFTFKIKAWLSTKNPFTLLRDLLDKEGMERAVEEAEVFGEEFIRELKRKIESQEFDWPPLDPDYKERKKEQGLDERILIATHDYLDGFAIQSSSRRGSAKVEIGVEDRDHEPSGLPLEMIARIHEYGSSRGVPARPHWRPVAREFEDKAKQKAEEMAPLIIEPIERILKERLKSKKKVFR